MSIKNKLHFLVRDNRTRSLLKTITYRTGSIVITIIVSLFVTGNFKIALAIGGLDFFAKMAFYYFHERIWHYSKIGR